jgi:hypothetical protein
MSIEIAYRAAVKDQQNLKRESDRMGPHLYELDAQRARQRGGRNWLVATLVAIGAAFRAMPATTTRIRSPGERLSDSP